MAVWIRKIFRPLCPRTWIRSLAPGCRAESQSTLDGFWDALGHARCWIRPETMLAAEQKIRQLRLAAEFGTDDSAEPS